MSLLKLSPACKDYLWGGQKLKEDYHKTYDGDVLAETWELSCYPDSPSTIVNGPAAGESLRDWISEKGRDVLGRNCSRFSDFPVLIKFIDAAKDLSIQVHPDNAYAREHEGQMGKTEMWYVMEAEEGAFLYYGFSKEITKEEFKERIENNTLPEVLNKVPVQKGDVVFIESGTLHAIGKGLLIAEIQQNSNVTYRVYDYGRRDKNGKLRDLHIEKALQVTHTYPVKRVRSTDPHIASCDYFTVDKLTLSGELTDRISGFVSENSFAHFLFLNGEGRIACGGDDLYFRKGDSFFLPAGSGDYSITGTCEALVTTERAKDGAHESEVV